MRKKHWLFLAICVTMTFLPAAAQETNYLVQTPVSPLVGQMNGINLRSPELINEGFYDNGIAYSVYRVNDSVKITVSTDSDGTKYVIGSVNSAEEMHNIINLLTKTFSKPIPHLDTGEFKAVFYDAQNVYIHNNMPDYMGTFTILGSQLFVEEVTVTDKIIAQRQWCMPDFYEVCAAELGEGWGFIASWDNK